MGYSNSSPYEEQIRKNVNKVSADSYDNIKDIIQHTNQISLKILRILIEYACLGQNIAPIELARKKIKEIDSSWLNTVIPKVAQTCICFDDEWEYRRLLELVEDVAPELIKWVISQGVDSSNDEVREAAEDFKNTSKLDTRY